MWWQILDDLPCICLMMDSCFKLWAYWKRIPLSLFAAEAGRGRRFLFENFLKKCWQCFVNMVIFISLLICNTTEYIFYNSNVESCPSGWRSTPGKRVYGKLYREFESLTLRHFLSKNKCFLRSDCSVLVSRKAISWTSSGSEDSSDKWIVACAVRVPGDCGPTLKRRERAAMSCLFLCSDLLNNW